jgi:hypothetical protein
MLGFIPGIHRNYEKVIWITGINPVITNANSGTVD